MRYVCSLFSAKNSFFPEKTILHDDVIDSLSENKYILKQETVGKCKALNKLAMEKEKKSTRCI